MLRRVHAGHAPDPSREATSIAVAALAVVLASSVLVESAQAQCSPVDINPTGAVAGALAPGDCTIAQLGINPSDTSFVDVYRVTLATDGFLTVTQDSEQFDSFLSIFDAALTNLIAGDDDGGGGGGGNALISKVPISAGTYLILANSFFSGETGSYTVNTLFELTGNSECGNVVNLPTNAVADGSLASTDCTLTQLGINVTDGSYVDQYRVTLPAGGALTVMLDSFVFDAFLWLYDDTLTTQVALDDDGGGGTNALIQNFQLAPGSYVILANSAFPEPDTGPYTLTVIPEPSVLLLRFAAAGALIALARSRQGRRRADG